MKHIGHHHHYHKPGHTWPGDNPAVKRTADIHFHDPKSKLEHTGNAIYGGPCICDQDVWAEAQEASKGIHTAWKDLRKEGSNLCDKMLRAIFTVKPKEGE